MILQRNRQAQVFTGVLSLTSELPFWNICALGRKTSPNCFYSADNLQYCPELQNTRHLELAKLQDKGESDCVGKGGGRWRRQSGVGVLGGQDMGLARVLGLRDGPGEP